MRKTTVAVLAMLLGFLLAGAPALAGQPNVEQSRTAEEKASGIPLMELEPKVAEILTVSGCERISGMTCRIKYNGKAALPSEVFFTEHDSRGKVLGRKTRLIYPRLEPGETGSATFRLRSGEPARIVLSAKWEGPWRDPY